MTTPLHGFSEIYCPESWIHILSMRIRTYSAKSILARYPTELLKLKKDRRMGIFCSKAGLGATSESPRNYFVLEFATLHNILVCTFLAPR